MEMVTNEPIPKIIHHSWHELLQPLFNNQKMQLLRRDILVKNPFYPAPEDIFRVFAMPVDRIKVVILGQDPYSRGEAIGFSFAVKETVKIPPSLEVIKQEIIRSKVERDTSVNIESSQWKTLRHWRQQGVFLLNTALTVERMNPGSHIGMWDWFTREVIKFISVKQPSIWLLWGAKAKAFKELAMTAANNYCVIGNHPAAQTRPENREKYPFVGNDHFIICNKLLKEKKQTIINW
jgi:uracil-DNA glycosylase